MSPISCTLCYEASCSTSCLDQHYTRLDILDRGRFVCHNPCCSLRYSDSFEIQGGRLYALQPIYERRAPVGITRRPPSNPVPRLKTEPRQYRTEDEHRGSSRQGHREHREHREPREHRDKAHHSSSKHRSSSTAREPSGHSTREAFHHGALPQRTASHSARPAAPAPEGKQYPPRATRGRQPQSFKEEDLSDDDIYVEEPRRTRARSQSRGPRRPTRTTAPPVDELPKGGPPGVSKPFNNNDVVMEIDEPDANGVAVYMPFSNTPRYRRRD